MPVEPAAPGTAAFNIAVAKAFGDFAIGLHAFRMGVGDVVHEVRIADIARGAIYFEKRIAGRGAEPGCAVFILGTGPDHAGQFRAESSEFRLRREYVIIGDSPRSAKVRQIAASPPATFLAGRFIQAP